MGDAKDVLAAGNSHHVTKACVLLCWTLLDFDQKNCWWRTKLGFSACRLQPSERPPRVLFCSVGTAGAAMAKNRSKRVSLARQPAKLTIKTTV